MTVRVNKPAFNLREKLSELERPIGIKGSELMKSDTTQDARDVIGAGRRNLCINGNFKCWQRGTSIASGATGNSSNTYKYVTADRWQTYFYNTYARQNEILPNGERVYALRETMQVTRNFLAYIIESGGRIWKEGGEITISFWARTNSNPTGVSIGFYWHDGWAGSAYTFSSVRNNVIIEGSEWKHYSTTAKLPANANNRANLAIEFDNEDSYGTWKRLTAGQWWEFANVQIEKGSTATDFEHRTEGEEMALCQRYYQNSYDQAAGKYPGNTDDNNGPIHTTWNDGNAPFGMFPTVMRAAPTVTLRPRGSSTTGQVKNNSVNRTASAQMISNQGIGYLLVSSGDANTWCAYSYELDAELS